MQYTPRTDNLLRDNNVLYRDQPKESPVFVVAMDTVCKDVLRRRSELCYTMSSI